MRIRRIDRLIAILLIILKNKMHEVLILISQYFYGVVYYLCCLLRYLNDGPLRTLNQVGLGWVWLKS